MKPTKNRVHCLDCNRAKMLFETEKQAMNFIKFNAEEIREESGYAPTRAYFCTTCCGWHVTSQESYEGRSHTDKVVSQFHLDMQRSKTARELFRDIRKEDAKSDQALDSIETNLTLVEQAIENDPWSSVTHELCMSAINLFSMKVAMIRNETRKQELMRRLTICVNHWSQVRVILIKVEEKIDFFKKRMAQNRIELAQRFFEKATCLLTQAAELPGEQEKKLELFAELETCQIALRDYHLQMAS